MATIKNMILYVYQKLESLVRYTKHTRRYSWLTEAAKQIHSRSKSKTDQYWERIDIPKQLSKIQSIFQWNEMPSEFKNNWVDYIENEFDSREIGHWFMNNGLPTYITGAHYMYLQWTSIDVGYPDLPRS